MAAAVAAHGGMRLVVDPVLISTSGDALAGGGVAEALLRALCPLATVLTPNLPEASALLGAHCTALQCAALRMPSDEPSGVMCAADCLRAAPAPALSFPSSRRAAHH